MSESEQDERFLSRWSRRKRGETITPEPELPAEIAEQQAQQEETVALESTQATEPAEEEALPIWQQKDADPELKRNALRDLFHQAEFNERDGLNDYDHDYTQERSLGDIVTNQMKRMIKLAEQKAEQEETSQDMTTIKQVSPEEVEPDSAQEHNEDDKLA